MLKETPKAGMDNKAERFVEKGVFQPSKEKRKGVYFPEYWRKKEAQSFFCR